MSCIRRLTYNNLKQPWLNDAQLPSSTQEFVIIMCMFSRIFVNILKVLFFEETFYCKLIRYHLFLYFSGQLKTKESEKLFFKTKRWNICINFFNNSSNMVTYLEDYEEDKIYEITDISIFFSLASDFCCKKYLITNLIIFCGHFFFFDNPCLFSSIFLIFLCRDHFNPLDYVLF